MSNKWVCDKVRSNRRLKMVKAQKGSICWVLCYVRNTISRRAIQEVQGAAAFVQASS